MGNFQQRCLFCARIFESEVAAETILSIPGEASKAKSICPICEARIKKEAEDAQKSPNPCEAIYSGFSYAVR